jgi:hypothetical protein
MNGHLGDGGHQNSRLTAHAGCNTRQKYREALLAAGQPSTRFKMPTELEEV